MEFEAEILASTFYPEAARKRPLVGVEPLVSFDKARHLIGYQPEFFLYRASEAIMVFCEAVRGCLPQHLKKETHDGRKK